MKAFISTDKSLLAKGVENIEDAEQVTIEFQHAPHYSAIWSLWITVDIWNGLPRIKSIETKDNWSDR